MPYCKKRSWITILGLYQIILYLDKYDFKMLKILNKVWIFKWLNKMFYLKLNQPLL